MRGLSLAGLLALAGCYSGVETPQETDASAGSTGTASEGGGVGPGSGASGAATGGADADDGVDGDGTIDGGATTDAPSTDGDSTGEPGPHPGEVELMCNRWTSDRADLDEGTWSGSVASCDPGDISASGRANALRLLNLQRFMVGLPEVSTDPGRDASAQACALMMHANGSLSHNPPMGWTCYSPDGAGAAGSSNISTGPGVLSVDLYMVDPGNPTTLGHRRWILSNSLGPVGLGSTSSYSCMWVIGGGGGGSNAWTAWPAPGPFPIEAVDPLGFSSLDETGWSIQSDGIDLSGAQVTITTGAGEPRPVSVTVLAGGYGSSTAISMIPQGWSTEVGTTYHVQVDGVGMPIEYDVHVVDCG
ncbi:MAG: CAP domain-containing protein [Nannocystaceae bacterium]